MKKNQSILMISIIAIIFIGLVISQLKFIPGWDINHIFIIAIFGLAWILAIIYIYQRWKINANTAKTAKRQNWVDWLVSSLLMLIVIPIIGFAALLFSAHGIMPPDLAHELEIDGKTIYIFHRSCFPPDGHCQCDDYQSLIYLKNRHLPIMHLVTEVNFYAGDIDLQKDTLIIYAAERCPQDKNMVEKVKLR